MQRKQNLCVLWVGCGVDPLLWETGRVALPQKNLKTERCSNPSSGHVPERLDSSGLRRFSCSENPRGQSKQIHTQVWSVLTLQCHLALEGCGVRLTLRGGSALTTLLSETLLRQDEVAGDPEGREVVHHFTDVIAPLSHTTECSGRDAEPCG